MKISKTTMQKFVNAHIQDGAGGFSNVRYKNKNWVMDADRYGMIDVKYGMIGGNSFKLHFYLTYSTVCGEAEQISILAEGKFEDIETDFGSYVDVVSAKVLDVEYAKEAA